MIENPTNLPRDFDANTLGLVEAEDLKVRLLNEVQDIQAQLGDGNREKSDSDWRTRAKWALTIKTRQYNAVKERVKRLRMASPDHPVGLLRRAHALLTNLKSEGGEGYFDTEEVALIDQIGRFFDARPEYAG